MLYHLQHASFVHQTHFALLRSYKGMFSSMMHELRGSTYFLLWKTIQTPMMTKITISIPIGPNIFRKITPKSSLLYLELSSSASEMIPTVWANCALLWLLPGLSMQFPPSHLWCRFIKKNKILFYHLVSSLHSQTFSPFLW